jgi:hypothetical protein
MNLDPNTVLAVTSAVLAVIGAIVSGAVANRTNRKALELDRQRRAETATEGAARVLSQYRDPLLDAAQTLQSRIYNLVTTDYLGRYLSCGIPEEERYARDYTVFSVAEYLCWVEIVRRELRFLDAGDDERTRTLPTHLDTTQYTFQTDKVPEPLRIFRGAQRAIAELMMVPTNAPEGPRSEALGYAGFCRRLDTDSEFASWFTRLRTADIDAIATKDAETVARLLILQHDLVDLIEFLDPDAVRIPERVRGRLAGDRPRVPAQPRAGTR